jgi:alkylation response protein AidB-like acyl-CoA dehydrogenase
MQEVFDRTIDYLKERKQFGVVIGSFQALKHRAAEMYAEIEICRSLLLDALQAWENDRDDLAFAASMVKAKCADTSKLVTNEGLQMHGGIGMTDELDIGLFMKRARVLAAWLGNASFHRDRIATMSGF